MRLLVLGGTAWLGRHIAQSAVAAGHDVTCLARGESGSVPVDVRFVRADRDAADGLDAVAAEQWDAVIDVSRQPGQVRRAAHALEPVADRFIFVSSCSAYADHGPLGQDESAPLLPALEGDVMETMSSYGEAKVACEQAVQQVFGPDRSVIVRAGLIAGPGDNSGRTGYWPLRFARPSQPDGTVLIPLAPDLPTQIIDVRDLAAWLVKIAEHATCGVFNATGDSYPFDAHLAVARQVAGHGGPLRAAAGDWLLEHGVHEWAGNTSLPLWLNDPGWYGMGAHSNERATAAGLTLRPLADTLQATLDWELETGADTTRRAGLTAAEEVNLLKELEESAG